MDTQTLLNRPQVQPKIVPKITKLGGLVKVSNEAAKSSSSLRKIFEKGSYQKKTQLSILNRYKRRLDSIQKQNDKNLFKRKKTKLKLPEIKKYAGNFFTPGSTNDPLKAIGALAAFNTASKVANKDYLGAIGPGLVFAGVAFGPSLLRRGFNLMRRGGGTAAPNQGASVGRVVAPPTGNRTVFGGITSRLGRVGSPTGTAGVRSNIGLTARQFQAGAFMQTPGARAAFPVALPGTPSTAERLGGASQRVANRFAARGGAIAAEEAAAKAGGAVAGRTVGGLVAKSLLPMVNIGIAAYRFSQGDPVGGTLSLLSSIPVAGWAAVGVDLAREFGWLDGTFLGRKGATNKLKKQTERQKREVDKKKKPESQLTFGKTLNRYERVVTKFEDFSKNFKPSSGQNGLQYEENIPPRNPTPVTDPYTGPVSGETFLPLPGAQSIGDPNKGQNYKASRGGRDHLGVDMTEYRLSDSRAPVVSYMTGKVIKVERGDKYPGGSIEVDHGNGLITRYLHITPEVNVGDIVYGGQEIARLHKYSNRSGAEQTHLHFEVYENNKLVDPTNYVKSAKNQLNAPLAKARAKEVFERSSKAPPVAPSPNAFVLEVHADPNAQGQKTGLMRSRRHASDPVSDALVASFGEYPASMTDKGVPNRGGYLLESDMALGVEANAQRVVAAMLKDPRKQYHIFAGHADVTTGQTGANNGAETRYNKLLAARIAQLGKKKGLNITYHTSIIANDANNPNSNFSRITGLTGFDRFGRRVQTPTLHSVSGDIVTDSIIEYPTPTQRSLRGPSKSSITVSYPVIQQQQVMSGGEGGGVVFLPGPSEQQLLNSFYRKVLLNTV